LFLQSLSFEIQAQHCVRAFRRLNRVSYTGKLFRAIQHFAEATMTGMGRQQEAAELKDHVGRFAVTLAAVAVLAALTASAQIAQPNAPPAAPPAAAAPVDREASGG